MKNRFHTMRRLGASLPAKIAAGTSALVASGAAFASGSGSAASAVAGELSSGKGDMGLIFAAVAILIGALVVWAYVKRAAR